MVSRSTVFKSLKLNTWLHIWHQWDVIDMTFNLKKMSKWTCVRHQSIPYWPAGSCIYLLAFYRTVVSSIYYIVRLHDDTMMWKLLWHYWPFVRGIPGRFSSQRASGRFSSITEGQKWKALMFSLLLTYICHWTNSWVAGNLKTKQNMVFNWFHYTVVNESIWKLDFNEGHISQFDMGRAVRSCGISTAILDDVNRT